MSKKYNFAVKVTLMVMLALSLFICSCKKKAVEPTEPAKTEPAKKVEKAPVAPVEEAKKEEAKAEVKKVVEPAKEKPKIDIKKNADALKAAAKFLKKASEVKGGLVAIPLELPNPMFVGTPQDISVPNLEKPLGKARPSFLAPAGVTNVALNKPVSSTDEEPIIGEIEMITDGDKEGADGSYVELGPFSQNVTIDLEAEYEIYAIVIWHFHKQARVYFDVVVQLADDADFINNVKTVFNNDHDNSSALGIGKDMHYVETNEGKLIDVKGQKARFLRLYSNGNTGNELNHYIEVAVYGKPVK